MQRVWESIVFETAFITMIRALHGATLLWATCKELAVRKARPKCVVKKLLGCYSAHDIAASRLLAWGRLACSGMGLWGVALKPVGDFADWCGRQGNTCGLCVAWALCRAQHSRIAAVYSPMLIKQKHKTIRRCCARCLSSRLP